MQTHHFFKVISVVFGVLAVLLLIGFSVSAAWAPPTVAPPGDNVPALLNVGTSDQTKTGGRLSVLDFWVNNAMGVTGGASIGDTDLGPPVNPGFTVSASGNLTEINNVPYSWPSAPGAAGTTLINLDGFGTLSWGTAAGGGLWTASGANIFNTNLGSVGIGTATPGSPGFPSSVLDVNGQTIIRKDLWVGSGITNEGNVIMVDGVDSSSGFFDGIEVSVLNSALTANASKLRGGVFSASHWSNSFSVSELIGVSGEASVAGGGGVTNMYAGKFTASAGSGNVSNMYALHAWTWLDVPGFTLPNAYGIYSRISKTPTTSITNGYGLYIADIGASNDYALYAAGADDDSYFAGNVGIGTTTPQSKLQITGGYLQLALTPGAPSSVDCDSSSERGRMKVDNAAGLLYICVNSGWVAK